MELPPSCGECERCKGTEIWGHTVLHLARIVNVPDSGNVEIEVQQLHIKARFLGQVSHVGHCTAEAIEGFSLIDKVFYHSGYP